MDRGEVRLETLFERRWMIPVLAELHRGRGAKFVTLVARTGASRKAMSETLTALTRLGLVMRNPGYGHPLRPEYVLTTRAMRAGDAFVELYDLLRERDLLGVTLKKWTLPVLLRVAGGARFSTIRAELEGVTDRALALALRDLQGAGLVTRLVLDSYPPTTLYQPTSSAQPLVRALERLLGEFPAPPAGAERRNVSGG